MRRCLWLVLTTIVMAGKILPAGAQGNDSIFYGLRKDTDTLFSYRVDGSTTDLLSGVNQLGLRLFPLSNPDNALLLGEVDGKRSIFMINTKGIVEKVSFQDTYVLENTNWFIDVQHHPYYLMHSAGNLPEATGILVNLNTLEAQHLRTPLFYNGKLAAAFSKDGTKLRYLGKDAITNDKWNIIERDVANAEERIIYTVEGFYPNVTYDTFAENWLYGTSNRDTGVANTILIKNDGSVVDIAQDDRGAHQLRILWNDLLYVTPTKCQADCPIKLAPIVPQNDETELTFTAPVIKTLPAPLAMTDDSHLLISDQGTFWLLGLNQSATNLGSANAAKVLTPRVLSSDNRWLLALTADNENELTGYKVWDLKTRQAVMDGELPSLVNIYFDDEGIIIWEYQDKQKVYRFSDGQTFTLAIGRHETIFALADDQTAIVSVGIDSKIGARGIYAYDFTSETYRLLAANAVTVYAG